MGLLFNAILSLLDELNRKIMNFGEIEIKELNALVSESFLSLSLRA